ncbi:threonine/serine dehydratase [Oceanibaculum sp.]|uniref:threonine/serine dehydratase n=1 Tax=Oceanibaculum sp. TaxID=1903597 RepID=UPI00258888A8|nr:threonine/serine dehydratase [Oceanibaculum sp.]MCH2394255.1 threonine/serine dehydratase [Oceanibaculum sp.]
MSAIADIPAALSPEKIGEALQLIRPHVRHTPVLRVDMADFGAASRPVDLKLEQLQHSGSFKARGAFTSLMTQGIPAAGVVAASGGNHGAAVAYAAMKRGVPATIFVPEITSPAKADRIRSYGARLEIGGQRYADALAASELFVKQSGALPIHAYDQPTTLLGQGTLGAEIEQDLPDIDTLLVAVGGGGLIGGLCAWYRGRVRIVAVEPEGAPTLNKALAAGHPVEAEAGSIAADSLAPRQVGDLMFPLARDHVTQSVLVSDDDILNAQKALWESVRVVTEPGGAAAFAALLSGRYVPRAGEKVAVLVCGANTTAVKFG